jgi:hypothetical protein
MCLTSDVGVGNITQSYRAKKLKKKASWKQKIMQNKNLQEILMKCKARKRIFPPNGLKIVSSKWQTPKRALKVM